MPVILALALSFAIMAIIVALQNAAVVEVRFLVWNAEASLALVVLISFGLGILAAMLLALPGFIRRIREEKIRHRQRVDLEEQVARLTDSVRASAVRQAPGQSPQTPPPQPIVSESEGKRPPTGVDKSTTAM